MPIHDAHTHSRPTSQRASRRNTLIIGAGLTTFLLAIAISFGREQSRPAGDDHDSGHASGGSTGAGDHSGVRDISSLIGSIRSHHRVPGVVAAIVDHDHVAAIGADGGREHDQPQRITIDDLFHIGSCTKSMTATMLGTLVEEGKLKWSTTVGEVFTELADKMDAGWKDVTLEQLLTHRSGAPVDLNADNLWARLWNHKGSPTEQRMTLVEGVLSRPPAAPPGSKYIYSNAGFAIAGAMAERITGQSWEDLMRTRLFGPLGMTSAGFGAPGTPGTATTIDQPRGHRADGQAVLPGIGADNPAAIGPAGTVHCSIGDWAKYIALHLNAERGECKLLKHETFEKLHMPYPANDADKYAMGWLVTNRDWAALNGSDGRVLTHAGSNTMWYCVAWLAPAPAPGKGRDFAVLVMCNQGGDDAAKMCDEIAWALIQDHVAKH